MKHSYLVITGLLFIVSCVGTKIEEKGTTGAINSSAPYFWSSGFPKTVRLSQDFNADETTAIQLMSTAWSTAVNNQKTFFAYGAVTSEKTTGLSGMDALLDSEMGIYKASNWPGTLPGSALAVTQIFGRRYNVGSSSEFVSIEHADVLVNDDFYDFDTADTGPGFDLRTVILHELGHFLGLQHKSSSSNRNSSVMFPSIDPTEAKRAPKSVDTADIANKYSITMPLTADSAALVSSGPQPSYTIKDGDAGQSIKILIELHADGNCVHKEDGVEVLRHPAGI